MIRKIIYHPKYTKQLWVGSVSGPFFRGRDKKIKETVYDLGGI